MGITELYTAYKVFVFAVILGRIFAAFSRITGKCIKNADQNNSEYGHFLRSINT